METRNLDPLLSDPSIETTEVLIGLDSTGSKTQLEAYMGEDGQIVKAPGFGIYRVRLTTALLADLVAMEPGWIDYIEHGGDDGVVSLPDMDNVDIGEES